MNHVETINVIDNCFFPTEMKHTDTRPAFKADDKTDKENYRSVGLISMDLLVSSQI